MLEPRPILLIRNTQPNFYGGAETYQLKLATELIKQHYQAVIVTSSRQLLDHAVSEHLTAIKSPYLHCQNWSGWRNFLLPLYVLWQVHLYFWYRRLFRHIQPMAINVQSRDDWIAATLAAHRLRIPVFWTDHIDFRTWVLTNVNQKFKNPIGKFILHLAPLAQKIIFISSYEHGSFIKQVAPRRFSNLLVVKNGSRDQYQHFCKRTATRQSLCYVGRLVDYKGIRELLAAFRQVSPEFPHATLNIYGDGDQALINEIQHTQHAFYHGFTDNPISAIAQSQIFVIPSYREGLSLSLLDAAMLGRAIIATDIDGNPEVVQDGHTGILVPAHDTEALANAMRKLLRSDVLCSRLGKNAREQYLQHFDFRQIVQHQIVPLFDVDS